MAGRYLVTNALEETWPNHKEKIIFLGEWCKLYLRKKYWQNLDYEVLDYHWDDKIKFEKDYYYLIDFYEKTLKKIAVKMNMIHQVNYGLKYWRILLGPWLSLFIQSVFDRWEMIQLAINSNHKLKSIILTEKEYKWTPYDYENFKNFVTQDDGWNNFIFSKIVEFHNNKIIIENKKTEDLKINNTKPKQNSFKLRIFHVYQSFANLINSNSSSLIISSYLNKIDDIMLSLSLFQLPLFINAKKNITSPPDINKRKWKLEFKTNSSFEKFLLKIIPIQVPSIYLEGYDGLTKKVKELNWPKNPKSIFTSNSIYGDELFKHYAGIKINKSIPLVVGQHGGGYGISKLSFLEYHELSIADKYISWGWTKGLINSKIYPIGQFHYKPKKKSKSNKTKLLIVTGSFPRYSYFMEIMPISSQWLFYFKNQIDFVNQLNNSIVKEITVRLYRHDYGWNQIERWKDSLPNLNYDIGTSGIEKHFSDTRLYIATYNSTFYLESFRLDIPTILFWNPCRWENRDSVDPIFKELKRVKVFHESAESAAKHINQIWDDVEGWWSSKDVIEIIKKFNKSLNKHSKSLISDLNKILK